MIKCLLGALVPLYFCMVKENPNGNLIFLGVICLLLMVCFVYSMLPNIKKESEAAKDREAYEYYESRTDSIALAASGYMWYLEME